MIQEERIAELTGISREKLREFRNQWGKKKGMVMTAENGAVQWSERLIAVLEADANLSKGEIEAKYQALVEKEAQEGAQLIATVLRLCMNPRIVLGTITGIEGACRIKIPYGRHVRPGIKLYVKTIGDHFYAYNGRVHE